MTTLMQASNQWASRPDDERFVSLPEMRAHFEGRRVQSEGFTLPSKALRFEPLDDSRGLAVINAKKDEALAPTHWSFGQLCQLAEAPAGYLRTLEAKRASPIVADCLNIGMMTRDVEDVGLLVYRNGTNELQAATGPNYGRVWHDDVIATLTKQFGDGVSGDWRVPGEWGRKVTVTKANTTLYAGDRDMFIFLADEVNRVEVPHRRPGETGTLARGFFLSNSMVGSRSLMLSCFYFDYVCGNRIVWNVEGFHEIAMRHTASAPDRWLDEVAPALAIYRNKSTVTITKAIEEARATKIEGDVDEYLAKRFGKRMASPLQNVHRMEEDRPIETVWDAATAATAYAKGIKWQDERVDLERKAGNLLPQGA